jgi:hypothetical protein
MVLGLRSRRPKAVVYSGEANKENRGSIYPWLTSPSGRGYDRLPHRTPYRDVPEQPGPATRLRTGGLPHRAPAFGRRVFDRLSGARCRGRAGGDQGIPAQCPGPAWRGPDRADRSSRVPGRFQPWPEAVLRGGAGADRARPSERGAGAEFLPRQRHGLPGDALRNRTHPARLCSQASGAACPRPSCARYSAVLLDGLGEVHGSGLLHLDIKPANIWLRTDDSPVLLDFGAARYAVDIGPPEPRAMYTPGYAAPEQYHGKFTLGPWTDIYAVGACMYAALTGSRAAGGRRAPGRRPVAAGPPARSRGLFAAPAGDHRRMPAPRADAAAATRAGPAGLAQCRASRRKAAGLLALALRPARLVMNYAIAQDTRIGGREINQDRAAWLATEKAVLMVVADGMGGHLQGEVAAQIAIDTLVERFRARPGPRLANPADSFPCTQLLAHRTIVRYAADCRIPAHVAPRTTCIACVVQDGQCELGPCRRFAPVPDTPASRDGPAKVAHPRPQCRPAHGRRGQHQRRMRSHRPSPAQPRIQLPRR